MVPPMVPPPPRRLLPLLLCAACLRTPQRPPAPVVAVVDDGERVGRGDGDRPVLRGEGNALWSPGQPARLFGLRGETVALQVVVTAGAAPLRAVTVELPELVGPGRLRNAPGPRRFQPIERLVVAELELPRRSGGRARGESLGWERGAMPPGPAPASLPEPLIPVDLAPPWADYPMSVAPGEHRALWIDLTLPEDLAPGPYRGIITARAGERELGRIELQLEVGAAALPFPGGKTLVYYDPAELRGVMGEDGGEGERHYLQLLRRHRLSPFYRVDRAADAAAQRDALSGALYTAAQGYEGPGAGRGAEVIVLGSYGTLGLPTPERVEQVTAALAALREGGALSSGPDLILYAADERCDSPAGPAWRGALDGLAARGLPRVLVAHTCSEDPARQRVDLPIVHAGAYDPAQAQRARQAGKRVWIYNGQLPRTGAFLSDGGFLSLRANGWIQARAGIERWFYWESTFWNDDNRGGRGPYDPLRGAETFHNQHGDWAAGDGVLVYPGRQAAPGRRSLGFPGVLPSLRLKQWRRGVSDAGYLELCRARGGAAAQAAEREAASLVGRSLREAGRGAPPWAQDGSGGGGAGAGAAFLRARRRLFELLNAPPKDLH